MLFPEKKDLDRVYDEIYKLKRKNKILMSKIQAAIEDYNEDYNEGGTKMLESILEKTFTTIDNESINAPEQIRTLRNSLETLMTILTIMKHAPPTY